MKSEKIGIYVNGHVKVTDKVTGEVLLDDDNAVHNQNMATAIARGLSDSDFALAIGNHQIYFLAMGNGGTTVDSMGNITFLPPNITGVNAQLYNQTYYDVVDPGSSANVNGNSVSYQAGAGTSSVVIVTMNIPAGLPIGEPPTDTPPVAASPFAFSELGLFTYSTAQTAPPTPPTYAPFPSDCLLLTHIIFSPILKTANREIVITYTLTVTVS